MYGFAPYPSLHARLFFTHSVSYFTIILNAYGKISMTLCFRLLFLSLFCMEKYVSKGELLFMCTHTSCISHTLICIHYTLTHTHTHTYTHTYTHTRTHIRTPAPSLPFGSSARDGRIPLPWTEAASLESLQAIQGQEKERLTKAFQSNSINTIHVVPVYYTCHSNHTTVCLSFVLPAV